MVCHKRKPLGIARMYASVCLPCFGGVREASKLEVQWPQVDIAKAKSLYVLMLGKRVGLKCMNLIRI